MDEVEILLKEYSKKDKSDHQKNGDDSMEYNIAKSKLRAVYGKLKKNVTLKQLSLQRSVTRWLGKTRPIGRQSVCLKFLYLYIVVFQLMKKFFLWNKFIKSKNFTRVSERSWIVSVYKGKGDALECGSYRGIKLLDQVMKVMERVIEKRVRSIVLIDEMQFGFRPGRGTTDAIFIVRQLQEKYLGRKRELWMAFLDLEKAFDRVPREVVWWALGQMNVDRSLINVIMSMYKNARASVKVNGVGGRDFPVEVGVHQGSVLSPLLFIIVMEALSRTFSDRGLPWELLYADDLVLLADTEDELKEKLQRW